ncbi:MAG: 50S ribosomal protein L3 [Patescibacteria group bacterium]|nr:50S ribosomal protein L3 [Patescibacteria group bacterium]
MIATFFGLKKNQTRVFSKDGSHIYVTNILVEPCVVTRCVENDSSPRYQLGIGNSKHLAKPQGDQLKKAGIEKKPRFFREVEILPNQNQLPVGSEIKVSEVFQVGDRVMITGVSKGKGFAGVVKRHGFAGGPKTHGQGDHWKAPGSIGSGTTPGRVYKGKRMAGRLGGDTVTIKGLRVVAIDTEKNILTVSGSIPGSKDGLVEITKQQ